MNKSQKIFLSFLLIGIVNIIVVTSFFFYGKHTLSMFPILAIILLSSYGIIFISCLYLGLEKRVKKSTRVKKFTYRKKIAELVKIEKKLDLNEASKISGLSIRDLKVMVYNLAADDKFTGEIKEDVLMIESGIDSFIKLLDNEFSKWEKMEKVKKGKI